MKKLLVLALASVAGASLAQTWNEVGDAGDLVSTGQMTVGSGALLTINGSQVDNNDHDLFCVFSPGGAFRATTVGGATWDTQLFLFDAAGNGIVGCDDDAGGGTLQSTIDGSLNAGFYWIGISRFDRDPVDAAGGELFTDNFPGLQSPTGAGPLAGWNGAGTAGTPSDYSIFLTGFEYCAVPEPATMAVLGLGAAALLRRRRK